MGKRVLWRAGRRRAFVFAVMMVLAAVGVVTGTAAPASATSLYVYQGPSGSYGFFDCVYSSDMLRVLSNPTSMAGGCNLNDVSANLPNMCSRSWLLSSSGVYSYNSGDSSKSCTS